MLDIDIGVCLVNTRILINLGLRNWNLDELE